MATGLVSRFNILEQSPHDFRSPPSGRSTPKASGSITWYPSRFNVRAAAGNDQLVVWNTYKGTMSVFEGEERRVIETLLSCQAGFRAQPSGVVQYLADRGFLIEEGTDEFRRIQLGFGRQQYRSDVLQLILLPSEDCNFRCEYCYEDFARGTMEPWVRRAVRNLVNRRGPLLRSLNIGWFGGEPLYGWSAIEELAPFFLEAAEKHDLIFSSHMTTNGYLLTPEVAEKLLSWQVNKFQITLDGAPEDHDRSRPARDGSGTFHVILDNLRALKLRPEQYFVDLRVNFDRKNHSRIPVLLEIVERELGDDPRFRLRFRGVGQWGGDNDENLDVCGADEAAQVQLDMKIEAQRRDLNLADDIRNVQGQGAQVCYAARPYNFIVGANGNLMKCTVDLDKKDRNIVGRIREEGTLDLDEDKMALWTEPAFERDQKCQKCVVLPVCQGVYCPQIRMDEGRSPCTPLRQSAKKELRAVVESRRDVARSVTVGSPSAAEQSVSV